MELETEPKKLKVAFRSIMINTIHFRKGDANDSLEVNSNLNPENLLIEFRDSGIGIKEEVLSKVFDLFNRGSTSSRGAGIGLYIARGIMTQLDSSILLESEVGQFTSVKIAMPINGAVNQSNSSATTAPKPV